jgi:hypothetical protein
MLSLHTHVHTDARGSKHEGLLPQSAPFAPRSMVPMPPLPQATPTTVSAGSVLMHSMSTLHTVSSSPPRGRWMGSPSCPPACPSALETAGAGCHRLCGNTGGAPLLPPHQQRSQTHHPQCPDCRSRPCNSNSTTRQPQHTLHPVQGRQQALVLTANKRAQRLAGGDFTCRHEQARKFD